MVAALPLPLSYNSLLFVLIDGGVRSWDQLDWGVSSSPSLSVPGHLVALVRSYHQVENVIHADVRHISFTPSLAYPRAHWRRSFVPCCFSCRGVLLLCPSSSYDLQCALTVWGKRLRSPNVINYIVVLLELCVVDCKVLSLQCMYIYIAVWCNRRLSGYRKDTPQVPVNGTCGKYPVWYENTIL